jgi:transposase
LLVLAGVAAAAWVAARRTAWLEEGEEMYRRELERAIADLDELEARVAVLRAELEAQRQESPGRRAEGVGPETEPVPHATDVVRLVSSDDRGAAG